MKRATSFYNTQSPLKRGSLFYLAFFGVIGMFLPFLNVYLRQGLGFSGRQIGVLAMLPPLGTLFITAPIASLADRRRWRIPFLQGAIGGFGVVLVLAAFPTKFVLWMGVRLLMASFACPIFPLADSLIDQMSLRYRLNYGNMRLWGSLSFALTAVGCGALWKYFGFRAMFALSGIAFIPVIFFASGLEEGPAVIGQQKGPSLWESRQDLGLIVLVVASFFVGASIHISMMFDGIYMGYLGGTQIFIGFMFGLAAFSEFPTMHYRDAIVRHLSGPKTLLLSYGLFIAAFLGYATVWRPWMLLLMAMIKGLAFGLFQTSTVRLVSERAPEDWAATIQSVVRMGAFGLAPLIASPLGGELFDCFGPRAIFLGNSLLVGSSALILTVAIVRGVLTDVEPNPNIERRTLQT